MINDIMRYVKARLGAYHRQLELDDDALLDCLENETLKTLSVYYPYYMEWIVNTVTDRVPDLGNHIYIPTEIQGHIVMGVERVLPKFGQIQSTGIGNIYGGILPSINNFINMQLDASILSAFSIPGTWTFLPPNMLRLNGEINWTTYPNYNVTLKTTHNKDFSTFQFGLREVIKKLAFYDICLDIYGIRKYFSNLATTFGDLNLDLDVLNVEDKRDDLIQKLRVDQIYGTRVKKLYIV